MNKYFYFFVIVAACVLFFSCSGRGSEADAYGSFEANDIIVSAEGDGKILELNLEEGQTLKQNTYLGYIDTLPLFLQKQQLNAQIDALLAQRTDIPKQLRVLQEKLGGMRKEKDRLENLLKSNAATNKQMDDLKTEIGVVRSQIEATKSNLNVQNQAVIAQIEVIQYQITSLEDAIRRCLILSPIDGTILKKYVNEHELIGTGRPIFKIADISKMTLKVYITEDQLSKIKIGEECVVRIDKEKGATKSYKGVVSWISDESEFTPKMIQTKNERVNLVYAVKIQVNNDGDIKIGMPGDVVFDKSKSKKSKNKKGKK